jgi:hypothetical protein
VFSGFLFHLFSATRCWSRCNSDPTGHLSVRSYALGELPSPRRT